MFRFLLIGVRKWNLAISLKLDVLFYFLFFSIFFYSCGQEEQSKVTTHFKMCAKVIVLTFSRCSLLHLWVSEVNIPFFFVNEKIENEKEFFMWQTEISMVNWSTD